MNHMGCNDRLTIQGQRTNCNVTGNNNSFIIRNSQVVLTVNGNSNKFDVYNSRITVVVNGNNNQVKAGASSLTFGFNGNCNQVRCDQECQQQMLYDNGYNNHQGSLSRPRQEQPRRNNRNQERNNVRQQQQPQQRRPSQAREEQGNRYSYPQYSNQPLRRPRQQPQQYYQQNIQQNVFQNMFGGQNRNSPNFVERIGINLNRMNVPQMGRVIQYPASRQFHFHQHQQQSEDEQFLGLTKQELQILPKSKHSGKTSTCIICQSQIQENEQQTYLMCFHSFHWPCIRSWLQKNGKCPVCQFDLRQHFRGQ